jgi:hypothetical protein
MGFTWSMGPLLRWYSRWFPRSLPCGAGFASLLSLHGGRWGWVGLPPTLTWGPWLFRYGDRVPCLASSCPIMQEWLVTHCWYVIPGLWCLWRYWLPEYMLIDFYIEHVGFYRGAFTLHGECYGVYLHIPDRVIITDGDGMDHCTWV